MSPAVLDIMTRYQAVAVAIVGTVAAILLPELVAGVLAGGVIMAGNFWLLKTVALKVMQPQAGTSKGPYIVILGFKFIAVFAALGILVLVFDVHPLGLALGMCTLFIGAGMTALHQVISPATTAT